MYLNFSHKIILSNEISCGCIHKLSVIFFLMYHRVLYYWWLITTFVKKIKERDEYFVYEKVNKIIIVPITFKTKLLPKLLLSKLHSSYISVNISEVVPTSTILKIIVLLIIVNINTLYYFFCFDFFFQII